MSGGENTGGREKRKGNGMGPFPLSTSRLRGTCPHGSPLGIGGVMAGAKSPYKCTQGGRGCPVTSVFSLGSGNLAVVPRLSLKAELQAAGKCPAVPCVSRMGGENPTNHTGLPFLPWGTRARLVSGLSGRV